VSALVTLAPSDPRWRAYALEHATTPLQHPSWLDAITSAYRLKARVAALLDEDGEITVALPMVASKLPWRKRWTALPFTDVLEPICSDPVRAAGLLTALAERAEGHPVLIRTHTALPGWFSRQVGTVQVLDLTAGLDGVLSGASRHARQNMRKAERECGPASARPVTSRTEFMGANLALIARSRSRVGVPTQPRRYWSRVWEMHEREEALTLAVYVEDVLSASAIFLLGRDHAVFKYSASDSSTRQLRTNYLALGRAIDHLSRAGMRSLDFGITDLGNQTLRRYKTQWGGEEQQAYFSATDAGLLPQTVEPGRLLSTTLQRTPTFVGRTVGSLAYPFAA
jgi:CelD/BcsL family acetyltransferase involved in cellulose biosynthesis